MRLRKSLETLLSVPDNAPYFEIGKKALDQMKLATRSGASQMEGVRDMMQTLEKRIIYVRRVHGNGSLEHHEAIREAESFKEMWMTISGREPRIQTYLYAPGGPLEHCYT